MKLLIDLLKILFYPTIWLQLNKYDDEWDELLVKLMKTHKFTDIGPHTATLGGYELWVVNIPYSCFHVMGKNSRPSRLTILRAIRKLKEDEAKPPVDYGLVLRKKALKAVPNFAWLRRHLKEKEE